MLYARRGDDRVLAQPNGQATCPSCDAELRAKCGEIVTWHWAHKPGDPEDCDPWAEGESAWHIAWKQRVPPEHTEVVMGARREHRADIATGRHIVELQHSALGPEKIRERERFYGPSMLWLWDQRAQVQEGRLMLRAHRHADRRRDAYRTVRWLHARRSLALCRRRVFLDLGDAILDLRALHLDPRRDGVSGAGGWGYVLSPDEFCARYLGAMAPSSPHPTISRDMPRRLGPYASCVRCFEDDPVMEPMRIEMHRDPGEDRDVVERPIGTWSYRGDIPLCRRHDEELFNNA